MWVEFDYFKEVKILVPISYRNGNWKCIKKKIAKVLKLCKDACGNSMCDLAVGPIKIHWKKHNQIESSFNSFDEHHK